ncbi:MAG TPA: hypothetical protein VEF90_17720 [Xanthobacteraceae bacterium]|nr:hypothetical protein [Xanthobacteraceae bacterium]
MGSAFVVVDPHAGSMTRYEIGGQLRKTHACSAAPEIERPVEFTVELVEGFRTHPPGEFYCGPLAPVPGGDTPGGTPAAARAAA